MAKKKKKNKYTSIGGQALMEGIMMRGPEKAVMCVRRADGSITSEAVEIKKPRIWNKIPILRGVVSFVQSMAMGTKMLMRSADLAIEDEEKKLEEESAKEAAPIEAAEEAAEAMPDTGDAGDDGDDGESVGDAESACAAETDAPAEGACAAACCCDAEGADAAERAAEPVAHAPADLPAAKPKKQPAKAAKKEEKKGSDGMGFFAFIATVIGFGMAILLFFFLPTWAYKGLLEIVPENVNAYLVSHPVWKSVFEGVLKLIIFIVYMAVISSMKEIKRLFQYHGAEHKTIFCYEAGEELTVENVRRYKRFHPRCGTSFIILMLLVGILAGIAISALWPQVDDNMFIRPLIKLAVIPLVMGVGYELLKFAGRHDNILTRIISAPGLLIQRLSTREPDDGQIECAIAAIKPVIPEDGSDRS